MNSDHGEPFAKRRRLADGQNDPQQHFGCYSETSGFMIQYSGRDASSPSHPAPSIQSQGMVVSSQFQPGAQAASQMHLCGTEPTFHGSFGMAQPWETASSTLDQVAWGQVPYFNPTHEPNHGHVWHNPTTILPMPHHLRPQGFYPLLLHNYHSLPTETAAIPYTAFSVDHQESPSSGPSPSNVLSNGTSEVSPESADSNGEEIVCFGMV